MIGSLTGRWQAWLLGPERGSAICDASVRISWERIGCLSRSACQLAILTYLVFRVCLFKSVISSLSILLCIRESLKNHQSKLCGRDATCDQNPYGISVAVSLEYCDIQRKEEPNLGSCQGLCIDFGTSNGCDANDHRASSEEERTARKDIKAFPPPRAQ